MTNPYADALTGLKLADPVLAFFDWCRERENIRMKRERGETPPWSGDPIFQKGRFLNVFREDDKGTKAVMRFSERVKNSPKDLMHALFFCRWCNLHSTLDAIDPELLGKPQELRTMLEQRVEQPWFSEAYPVVSAQWEGQSYDRLRGAVELFPLCLPFLEESIRSAKGNVVDATAAINKRFNMSNDFPIFMALVDLASFRPDLIHPASPVPTGIGSAPFFDLLQNHLGLRTHHETAVKMMSLRDTHWPESKRPFMPIDIEYLSCECRKYYSYVNGTKTFEGRNAFRAARV